MNLNYPEYITSLAVTGVLTAVNLFCWLVIFTFRNSLLQQTTADTGKGESQIVYCQLSSNWLIVFKRIDCFQMNCLFLS